MTPTFTVLIGSIGRPTLKHSLESIARQARIPGDQVIVAFDAFEQSRADLETRVQFVKSYGEGFHACAYDSGEHHFGVKQINWALEHVPITGSHIITIGDDDVLVDQAYATLRPICEAEPDRPIMYRFLAPWREVLPDHPRMAMSRISGCCIAAPKQFVGPMPENKYWPHSTRVMAEHDFFWMQDILSKAPAPRWLDDILVIARPDARDQDVAHQGVMHCRNCQAVRYYEDLEDQDCPRCGALTDFPGRKAVAMRTWDYLSRRVPVAGR